MASTATYKCKCCGDPFTARVADRARGWAKFCSKSCKAIRQTQKTGRGRGGSQVGAEDWHDESMSAMEEGWNGHKVWSGNDD